MQARQTELKRFIDQAYEDKLTASIGEELSREKTLEAMIPTECKIIAFAPTDAIA